MVEEAEEEEEEEEGVNKHGRGQRTPPLTHVLCGIADLSQQLLRSEDHEGG